MKSFTKSDADPADVQPPVDKTTALKQTFELINSQLYAVEERIRAQARAFDPAVEGYVGNDGPLRLTNVRLRVDVLGTDGTAVAHAFGWVIGDVTPGGRGYFVVPVPTPGTAYRVSVLSFDIVSGGP